MNPSTGNYNQYQSAINIPAGALQQASAPTPSPAGRIHTALDYTNELLMTAIKLSQELEGRLSPILEPAKDANSGVARGQSSASPLTERVADLNTGLMQLQNNLSGILRRLEV
jgi:hypothetical protein